MAYGDFKDLTRKTASFGGAIKIDTTSNKELAEELQKSIIRMFKKMKHILTFIDRIWGADLVDMQLIKKILIKEFVFHYVLLILSVNTQGLFL